MTYLADQQATGTGSSALDILNVLDILKNQDLYQERLQAIKEATKALNDGKYVAATMEQAQTIMEAAKVAKERAETEIKEARAKLQMERKGFEERMRIDLESLKEREGVITNLQTEVDASHWAARAETDRLKKEREELLSFRKMVDDKAEEGRQYYQRYFNKMTKIQEIINS